VRVLGIAGSLRQDSHNSRLLAVAGALLPAPAELGVFARLRSVAGCRLGLAPPGAGGTGQQAGGGGGREHRDVRSGVGAGRAAQGARRHRGRVLDRELAVPNADEAFTTRGGLVEAGLELELASLLIELSEMVSLRPVA